MTDEDKALVTAMKDQIESWEFEDPREDWWKWQHQYAQAADRIEYLSAENERLREYIERLREASKRLMDDLLSGGIGTAQQIEDLEAALGEQQ